jgi:glyoxylase-like metal-dependent hydrolase (beta-lactamase superfamily II)
MAGNAVSQTRRTIDRFLNDGSSVSCKGVELGVIHTPGHTPGSTCFLLANDRNILFAGDTDVSRQHWQNGPLGRVDSGYTRIDSQRLLTFERRHARHCRPRTIDNCWWRTPEQSFS